MPEAALLSILTGSGVAGVFCVLFVLGWIYPRSVVDDLKAERNELAKRIEAERDRSDAAVAAAQTTRDVLQALQSGISMGRAGP